MAVIKAYLDDSGDENDPKTSVCSLAGYIATIDDWINFEISWKQVLKKYEVKYLHMREYAHSAGEFKKSKNNEIIRKEFLQSLIAVVKDSNLSGMASILLLDDLKKFNIEKGVSIDAVAFNMYVCMAFISQELPNECVEIIIDRTNKPGLRKDLARYFADTDRYFPDCGKNIQLTILDKCLSHRNMPTIQLADLLAWESRKDIEKKIASYNDNRFNVELYSYLENLSKRNIYLRNSLKALLQAVHIHGFVLDYERLCLIANARNNRPI